MNKSEGFDHMNKSEGLNKCVCVVCLSLRWELLALVLTYNCFQIQHILLITLNFLVRLNRVFSLNFQFENLA